MTAGGHWAAAEDAAEEARRAADRAAGRVEAARRAARGEWDGADWEHDCGAGCLTCKDAAEDAAAAESAADEAEDAAERGDWPAAIAAAEEAAATEREWGDAPVWGEFALVVRAAAACAEAAAEAAERAEADAAALLAQDPGDVSGDEICRGERAAQLIMDPARAARIAEWCTAARAAWKAREVTRAVRAAEERAEMEAQREARVAEAEAADAARLARLVELVAEHGSASVQERIAAGGATPLGLLPEAEAVEIIRAARLPVGEAGLSPYLPLARADVRKHCDSGHDCASAISSYRRHTPEEAGGLTATEWAGIAALRQALAAVGLPPGEIVVHRGQCDGSDCPSWPARRIGVRVQIDLGSGLEIGREYGIDN